MDWLKQLLLRNWWLKLLSLALAYALWSIITQAPPVEIQVSALLELRQVPASLEVAGEIPPRVHLHLRGPENRLRALQPEEVGVVVNLNAAKPGHHVIQLTPAHAEVPPGIEVVRTIPDQVHLELVPR